MNVLNAQERQILHNKKAIKYFEKAKRYWRKKEIDKAQKYFEKVIKKEPGFVPPYLYQASICFNKKDYSCSKNFYKKVLQLDSTYNNDIYYSLARVYESENDLEEALRYYKLFLTKDNINTEYKKRAKRKLPVLRFRLEAYKHPVKYEPVNIGDGINTADDEYLPVLTGDNSTMIFTRRIHQGVLGQEDFFVSKNIAGVWQKARAIVELNTRQNEGAQTLSPDGKTMIFTVCGRGRTYGNCDLVISHKINGFWSKPKNMGKVINSVHWESQPALSADGRVLYFSSNRPGGVGGDDIWYTVKDSSGRWTKPRCLDTTINTKYDENTPFIHPDDVTLYFTSNGHTGMGKKDIFLSVKDKGKWSKPLNLGYPINTEDDDAALFVSFDGQRAYFSTDRNSGSENKNMDIYYFVLPEKLRPKPVTYIKGIVYDANTNQRLAAKVNIYDNNTGKLIKSINSDQDSFFVSLPLGIDYNVTVSKKGYAFYSDRIRLDDKKNTAVKPYRLGIPLVKINEKPEKKQESIAIILHNIFFEFNSAKLDVDKSAVELNNLYKLLKDNPGIKIKIVGHTDNTGSKTYNDNLSVARAKSVYDYLIQAGISKSRLEYSGKGSSNPIDTNDTEIGRSHNRRVEFLIIQ